MQINQKNIPAEVVKEVPPCGCIELIDGQFTYQCECSNRGDGELAAAWCVEANYKASADYDKCTIEFLRKEAAEAAARIEQLEAALRLLHDNVVHAWPSLADLGPVAIARAALEEKR